MIKLYKFPFTIELGRLGHGVQNENRPMGQSDFAVQKGGLVSIDFVVRNNDRKPVNLVGKTLSMILMDRNTGAVVLRKTIKVKDAYKGVGIVNFVPTDTLTLTPRHYRYGITMTNEDGTQEFLYFDQKQAASGYVEIRDDAGPRTAEAIEIDMTIANLTPFEIDSVTRYSAGAFMVGGGITTIAVYTSRFHGKFWVQASLADNTPADDTSWIDLDLGQSVEKYWLFDDASGIESFNFVEKVKWIRFVVEPDDIQNEDTDGKLTKIFLRT